MREREREREERQRIEGKFRGETFYSMNFHTAIISSILQIYAHHSLNPWSTVLLEKPTGLQLVKIFPAFFGTRRFITAFTSARHLSLS
jgi:hypothetical protein